MKIHEVEFLSLGSGWAKKMTWAVSIYTGISKWICVTAGSGKTTWFMPLWKNLQFFTLCLCRDPLSYSPANWNSAWRLNTWPFEMPPLALKGWSWMEFIIPHIHTHLTYQYLQPKIVLLQNPISMSYYLDLISIQHPVCLYITYIICRITSNYHGTIMELPYHWNGKCHTEI